MQNDNDIEVNLNVGSYNTNEIEFNTVDRLINEEGRIAFSILVQIKQKRNLKNMVLQIELVHFTTTEEKSETDTKSRVHHRQLISRLPLEEIHLFTHKKIKFNAKQLMRDPWKIRQDIRINLTEVPVRGTGNHAIAAYVKNIHSDSKPLFKDLELLDCAYFEVV